MLMFNAYFAVLLVTASVWGYVAVVESGPDRDPR